MIIAAFIGATVGKQIIKKHLASQRTSEVCAALAHYGHPCGYRHLHGLRNIRNSSQQKLLSLFYDLHTKITAVIAATERFCSMPDELRMQTGIADVVAVAKAAAKPAAGPKTLRDARQNLLFEVVPLFLACIRIFCQQSIQADIESGVQLPGLNGKMPCTVFRKSRER